VNRALGWLPSDRWAQALGAGHITPRTDQRSGGLL